MNGLTCQWTMLISFSKSTAFTYFFHVGATSLQACKKGILRDVWVTSPQCQALPIHTYLNDSLKTHNTLVCFLIHALTGNVPAMCVYLDAYAGEGESLIASDSPSQACSQTQASQQWTGREWAINEHYLLTRKVLIFCFVRLATTGENVASKCLRWLLVLLRSRSGNNWRARKHVNQAPKHYLVLWVTVLKRLRYTISLFFSMVVSYVLADVLRE